MKNNMLRQQSEIQYACGTLIFLVKWIDYFALQIQTAYVEYIAVIRGGGGKVICKSH